MDWSDKVVAYNIDDTCARYSNQSTEVQFYPHSAKLEERWGAPQTPRSLHRNLALAAPSPQVPPGSWSLCWGRGSSSAWLAPEAILLLGMGSSQDPCSSAQPHTVHQGGGGLRREPGLRDGGTLRRMWVLGMDDWPAAPCAVGRGANLLPIVVRTWAGGIVGRARCWVEPGAQQEQGTRGGLGLRGMVCAGALRPRGRGGSGRAWWEPESLAGAPTDGGSGPRPARSASTPESWAKFTQEKLDRAERERLASVNLRGLIDCILRDTGEDLRLQCDAVNLAFGRRCEELEDARVKLELHLRKVGPGVLRMHPGLAEARPGHWALRIPNVATMLCSLPSLTPASPLPLPS